MILMNPVVISVIVMIALCLLNLNIVLALLIAALVAGLSAGMNISDTMGTLISGMGGNAETALAYFLLGTFAVAIGQTGIASIACKKIAKVVKGRKYILLYILVVIACMSQNLVPVHIAFIPILIPPLLLLFNELKMDRRAAACALTVGLKAPYNALPVGFGLIFHGIVSCEMGRNGMEIAKAGVFHYTWIIGAGMIAGLLIALHISYRKPRIYENKPIIGANMDLPEEKFTRTHVLAFLAIIVAFAAQLMTGSLPLGALAAIIVMILTRTIEWKDIDSTFMGGLEIMGLIAFVMLIAAGYGNVLRETKSVDTRIKRRRRCRRQPLLGRFLMLAVGLLVTMGIGTRSARSRHRRDLLPACGTAGFSIGATTRLIAAAAARRRRFSGLRFDAWPYLGLNADGQHNHIWDTCVPTFLHYNIPIFIAAMIGALVIY
ncbi:MAG: Na+/H+ antiporter NhaC family protein [Cloacibacillus evryensis]